jgi:hypothetical protein
MDAHDEFFSKWCEPEAWCERCEAHPAIHTIVHHDDMPLAPRITYIRVWAPDKQAHVALCLQCHKEHGRALGSQPLQYVPSPPTLSASAQKRQRQYREHPFWPHLRRWGAVLAALGIAFWARRKLARPSTTTKPYSHTGT